MQIRSLIEIKRDGGKIDSAQWHRLMQACAAGEVPDYQLSALAMAIFFQGLDREETGALTSAMLRSGASLDLSHIGRPRVDKHSTGGVGDKVSLILAPLVASLGVAVPMMSGRSLGHTGGTLDKLESIPGFETRIPLDRVQSLIEKLGCALFGQTDEIAPADRRLYALRDATGTVPSIPMISASIMSKKLAESLTGLVLDVKVGRGAFLPEQNRAELLARTMIELGADHNCPVVALLTAMDRPLGRACGNALEMEEAILCLKGEGPSDLMDVTMALSAEMLLLADSTLDRDKALTNLSQSISSGHALELFGKIIEAQGGNRRVLENCSILPQAPFKKEFVASESGVVTTLDPLEIGKGITALGGGREKAEDAVDAAVGFVFRVKPGDRVSKGQSLAMIYARDETGLVKGEDTLKRAVTIGNVVPDLLPLIISRVTTDGVESYS